MDTKLKSFLIIQIIIVIITATLGQFGKTKFKNCGIQNVTTIEGVYELDVSQISFLEEEHYEGFIEYQEEYISDMEDADIVAIIKPTGNIRPYYFVLGQEVIIEDVIQGDKELENQTLYIYDESKFAAGFGGYEGLEYLDIKNVMLPGHTYLAFFSPSELNAHSPEKSYRFIDSFFNYLDLGQSQKGPIVVSAKNLTFTDVKEMEFFTDSIKTLDAMMEIKRIIIKKYMTK